MVPLASLDDSCFHLASNWKCDFSLQVQINGILIIIISVNCLNLANLIVLIKLMLRGVILRNVPLIKCISENTFNILVKVAFLSENPTRLESVL
jgi:hypothetical protein